MDLTAEHKTIFILKLKYTSFLGVLITDLFFFWTSQQGSWLSWVKNGGQTISLMLECCGCCCGRIILPLRSQRPLLTRHDVSEMVVMAT